MHPEDILYNASLLIKPLSTSSLSTTKFKVLEDNFVHLAQFDYNKGLVDVLIPGELNPVVELRVVNEHNSSHWLIINEVCTFFLLIIFHSINYYNCVLFSRYM